MPMWEGLDKAENALISIEEIEAPDPSDKIKGKIPTKGEFPLEIVLHADEIEAQTYLLGAFKEFLEHRNYQVDFGRRFYAGGLCFLEIETEASWISEIAKFSMIRALREMPSLRILRPTIRATSVPSRLRTC